MTEIYTKDNNGKYTKIGNANVNAVKNSINASSLDKYLNDFWSDKKCGKHAELAKKHKSILLNDMLVSPKDLFEQLNKNTFNFQNFGPISFSVFLKNAKLDSYLKPEFIEHALNVTTHQPAIGKGEFLLVSCFKNINFADGAGDLIDTDGNRIEVKGSHAPIGGPKHFKQMNKSLMFSIYRLFDTNPDFNDLTIECAKNLDRLLIDNNDQLKKVMLLLQNNEKESNNLANEMVELYNDTHNLIEVVASAHLYAYLKIQKANFLFAVNDKLFAGFASPNNIKQSYNIIKHFKVNGWTTGNKGITFTLKKD